MVEKEQQDLSEKLRELELQVKATKQEMADHGILTNQEVAPGHSSYNNSRWNTSKAPKFKTGESFDIFCERFTDYVKMTKQRENLDTLFMLCVDDETYITLNSTVKSLSEEEKENIAVLCDILKDEYLGQSTANNSS